MLTSLAWLNRCLEPGNLSAEEAVRLLEAHSFPIEGIESLAGGDARLDVELTSNRGDCLCHLGLAREIAAVSGRKLITPAMPSGGGAGCIADHTSVDNTVPERCPRFTARLIRGVKVGPSPKWLVEALESVGQRSINNIVDMSNFILLSIGHPNHAFDLNTLAGRKLIVRHAHKGEKMPGLDGVTHALVESDVVVADAERAQSIAGIVGGVPTSVTERTTDVLLEMATWNPIMVRRTARRLGITTDAAYRFTRTVDARDLEWASAICAQMMVDVAGGEIVGGFGTAGLLSVGAGYDPLPVVELRAARCEHILGIAVEPNRMVELLEAIGIEVRVDGTGANTVLNCTIPPHRAHELLREIDLIEEIVRLHGFDNLTVAPTVEVNLDLAHPESWAKREKAMALIGRTLAGLGFYETATFSFVRETEAMQFLPEGMRYLKVDEDRRPGAPYLRTSLIPSLLGVRKANQDARVNPPGGVRLFETAAVFAERDDGTLHQRNTLEHRSLGVLMDVMGAKPERADTQQEALRTMRGVMERTIRAVGGPDVQVNLRTADAPVAALRGEIAAKIELLGGPRDGAALGWVALIANTSKTALRTTCELDCPVVVAELDLAALIALYPPSAGALELPEFPGIERDLSVVVDERVPWGDIESAVRDANPAMLENVRFVGAFRSAQLGDGCKSVTLRLAFRDPARTLRHEEVDPQVEAVLESLRRRVSAELRV